MKKEEKTRLTKEKILAAATDEFGKNGYRGGTVNAVCSTGINKGLIYHNYKDKDDLYLACVQRMLEDFVASVEKKMEQGASYADARKQFFQENESAARLFLEVMVNPPEELEESIQKLKKPLDDLNHRELTRILTAKKLRPGVTREMAYRWCEALQNVYNLGFRTTLQGNENFFEELSRHEQGAARFIDLMLYGIAVEEKDA